MSQFNINLIWDASVLSQPNAAQIEAAITSDAQVLASNFSNPLTLNLHVGWGEVGGDALGARDIASSEPNQVVQSYAQLKGALPSLPASASSNLKVTDVEAAAIGLSSATTVEGYVGFNDTASEFVFTSADLGGSNYVLADVFDHEVTELMGRDSSVGVSVTPTVLDLYRYSAPNVTSFSAKDLAYFSTDGGVTNEASFNSDPMGDSGDWSRAVSSDSFDAFGEVGVPGYISQADQDVMTALGWRPTSASWDGVFINSETEAWLGRTATATDDAFIASELANGWTPDEVRQQLLQYTDGQNHTNAEVTSLYQTYLGRSPTTAELSVWQNLVLSGDSFAAVRSAILADPSGVAHTDATIKSLYDTWFGRDPSAAETSTWEGLIAGGQDFTALRLALVNDPSAGVSITSHVTSLYETWFGRDPTASELSTWAGLIKGGDDLPTLRATLIADPAGQAYIVQTVTNLYEGALFRAPSVAELSVWQGLFAGGDSFSDLSAALTQVQVQTEAAVPALYQSYMGRAATGNEVAYWDSQIVGRGATDAEIRGDIIADASGQLYVKSQVTSLYDTWFGRAPSSSELSVWDGLIANGAGFADVRSALISDPTGQAFINQTVTALYEHYLSREPSSYELPNWRQLIAAGDTFDDVAQSLALTEARSLRTILPGDTTTLYETYLGRDPTPSEVTYWQNYNPYAQAGSFSERDQIYNSAEGLAYFSHEATSLFDTYLGRDPNAQELAFWETSIQTGDDYGVLRATLLLYPAGHAHTDATVTSLYDTYFGRDPTAGELTTWEGLVAGGADFAHVRTALVNDSAGQVYAAGQITSLYETYFQRASSGSEIGVWDGLLANGANFDTVRDALERNAGAAPAQVTNVTLYPHQTVVFNASTPNVVASGFDPATDSLGFHTSAFSGVNFLDAAHARQITALDGSADVLITVDTTHSILLEHVQLAQLNSSDFLFS